MKMAFYRNMNISETKITAKKKCINDMSKDRLCKVWGENVRSGARYGCKCNVLRDGGIRFIQTHRENSLIEMNVQINCFCVF